MQTSRVSATKTNTAPSSPSCPQKLPKESLAIVKQIESEISSLYAAAQASGVDEPPPTLSSKTYLRIYNRVHEYDIATRAQDSGIPDKHLHHWLDSQIRDYCISIRNLIFGGHGNKKENSNASCSCNLLSAYMSCYRKFCRLATLVGNMLRSWERHGLRRERGDKTYVASVEEMHQVVWREEILGVDTQGPSSNDGLRDLKHAISVSTETDAETGEHAPALVEDVIKSLSVLGIVVES